MWRMRGRIFVYFFWDVFVEEVVGYREVGGEEVRGMYVDGDVVYF